MQELQLGGVPVKVWTDDIDQGSIAQLGAVSRLPIVTGHVAVMPDVHVGIGATIGSVIPTRKALIPAAVGVDIGCGMTAMRLSLRAEDLPDNLRPVREAIENRVPVGRAGHQRPAGEPDAMLALRPQMERTFARHPELRKRIRNPEEKFELQAGSLGSGNHFVELAGTRRPRSASGSCSIPAAAASATPSDATSRRSPGTTCAAWTSGCPRAASWPTSKRAPSTSTTTGRRCAGVRRTPWRTGAR